FEGLFAMPHGRDLVSLAAGFGWPTRRVADPAELGAVLRSPVEGIDVLVVPIDPDRTRAG
ncbi:MAG: hypothetical protein WBL05_04365, partial [Brooklawnia sp.]|uniref:hypothetical protein n=1 Tax=Brooklawnia sp. TaxID=2699740 RepID=UPI003C7470EE